MYLQGLRIMSSEPGRAGRRAQAVPVCVTFAKNARWDRETYDRASDFITDQAKPPFVHLSNPRIFLRHQFAVILGHWLWASSIDRCFSTDWPVLRVTQSRPRTEMESISDESRLLLWGHQERTRYLDQFIDWLRYRWPRIC